MISDDMKSVLIVDKSEDKLFLIGKLNSYTKNQWLGFLGYKTDVTLQYYNNGDKLDLSENYCDDLMCFIKIENRSISIVHNSVVLPLACKITDIVVSKRPVNDFKECKNTKVIDRFDVWRRGAAHITTNGGDLVVKYVEK